MRAHRSVQQAQTTRRNEERRTEERDNEHDAMTERDLNDELNDELNPQHELASAYLDGVASPAERAQVEAAPELLDIVASFSAVRARVADVPTAAADTREAAFAAAFAEFDVPALSPAAAGALIIPLNAQRRWVRPVLSIAAAVLLIGTIGVAANGGLSGSDSESSSMDTSAKVASADASTEADIASDTMAAAAPASTIGSIGGGAQAALIIDTPEQLQELASDIADTVVSAAALPETTAAASESTASAQTVPAPTDLAATAYTRAALGCLTAQQVFLADIRYQGVFAIVARDTVTGMTSAITDDCTVLATVGP